MKNLSLFLFLAILFLGNIASFAQSFGGHPSNIEWQKIDSENVRVIFPKGLDKNASRIADVVEHIHANNTYSVGDKSKKLDIILQTNQVISNGFVGLSPYVSEFFGTGLQNSQLLGSADWLDLLSIHEYRHALQFTNANRGLTKLLRILQGQNGWSLGMNFSVPGWYFEGDATLSETLLSKSGRGRTPSFFKELRANLLNDRNYSYLTSRNGSYKKMLPSHYPLGYVICNYTRNEYGMDIWKDILADAGRYRSIIYPFSGAMKRHTGKRVPKMYKSSYEQLKNDWEKELSQIEITPTESITKKSKQTVTNYNFAQFLKNGSIVALKNSFKEIPHIVIIEGGKERKLTNYGFSAEPFLSENNGILAWTELQIDPRRGNRNYSTVITYNMATGEKRFVTSKSKYFSPQVSSKGGKIVVIKSDENLQNQLLILDAIGGNVVQELPNADNQFLSFPKWAEEDNAIVYIAKRNSELALIKYDLTENKTTMLTDWTAHTIGALDIGAEYAYFASSFSGIDNIYAVNLTRL